MGLHTMSGWTLYPPPPGKDQFSPEQVRAYFDDPALIWLEAPGSIEDCLGKPTSIPGTGWYVMNFCQNVHCCFPFGPFASEAEAREHSRTKLPETQYA
jgi:hypothetical protein